MRQLKPFVPFFILIALSASLIYWLFPSHHPFGGIRLPLTADSVLARSQLILRDLGIDRTGMIQRIQLKESQKLLQQVQQRYGCAESNSLLRDSIPGYYWEVSWRAAELRSVTFGSSSGGSKDAQGVSDFLKGDVYFRFGVAGKVLDFERKIPDSARITGLTIEGAKTLASTFLARYSAVGPRVGDTGSIASARSIQMPTRIDQEFEWLSRRNTLNNPLKVKVTVAGNQIAKFSVDEEFPKETSSFDPQQIYSIAVLLLYIGVSIVMIVVAFRRFRSYEIGFRLAVIVAITAGVLYDITSYLEVRIEGGWVLLVTMLVVPLFVGGALLLVWAVSESVVREAWKDKFISFDLLAKGHFLHSRVGASILYGIAGGTGALALWLILSAAIDPNVHLWTNFSDDQSFRTFEISSPIIYILVHSFNLTIFKFAIFVLFLVTFLRKYLKPSWMLISASAVVMGILNSGHLYPLLAGFAIQAAVGVIAIWLFTRYDGLASLVSLITFDALQETAALFTVTNPAYGSSGLGMVSIFGLIIVVSIATLYRKKQVTDFDDIAPAFVRHITERQRLQQELEIARTVQMSFLPKTNPVSSRLDIASRCAPALEVGGDYYDFIDLGDKKLGVAIGDVSGKGTQAAFFMTLMKGFLNALAHVSDSPSRVLEQVNRLFYENVERGVFISMVYGIFDTKKNTLKLARAGHNPVIMRKSKEQDVQVVNTKGLALGLDHGDTFARAIEEVSIKFQTGDLFVFYTDGFTEAMNKTKEEFGEDRLCRTVETYSSLPAAEIMEGVFRDMKQFTGKANQHDDMTIVVVKVS